MTAGGNNCVCGLTHKTYDLHGVNMVLLLEEYENIKAERDIYRSYYISSEEGYVLSDTVGVTREEWKKHHKEYMKALDACEKLENKNG